jgi:hypothetical protein
VGEGIGTTGAHPCLFPRRSKTCGIQIIVRNERSNVGEAKHSTSFICGPRVFRN